jgi:hypothetical protein
MLMEGIVDDPHLEDNVTTCITPKNDLTKDLTQAKKFIGENFMLWKFQMGIMICAKKMPGIVDGTKEKTNENEVDWLHKDHVCQTIICASINNKFIWHIMTCHTFYQMWRDLCTIYEQIFNNFLNFASSWMITLLITVISNIKVLVHQVNDFGEPLLTK